MKTYYILLAFGIFLSVFGLIMMATPYRSSPYVLGTQLNYAGIFGFIILLGGILISIVSGILIERERKRRDDL